MTNQEEETKEVEQIGWWLIRMVSLRWYILYFDMNKYRLDTLCAGPFDHINDAKDAEKLEGYLDLDKTYVRKD